MVLRPISKKRLRIDVTTNDAPAVPMPSIRLDIDRGALAENWRMLDKLSGSARAGAAVKADCYGLGVDACLPALAEAGARDFFVAHWSEVPDVLKHVGGEQLAVLHGANTAEEARYALATGVRPVINSLHQAAIWKEAGGGQCHLMVDTGIHRLGILPEQVSDPAIQSLDIGVLMSHLSSADEDCETNARQHGAFPVAQASHQRGRTQHRQQRRPRAGRRFCLRPHSSGAGTLWRDSTSGACRRDPSGRLPTRLDYSGPPSGAGRHGRLQSRIHSVRSRCGSVPFHWAMPTGSCAAGGRADGWNMTVHACHCWARFRWTWLSWISANAPASRLGDWLDVPYDLPEASKISGLSQYELLTVLGQRMRR